MAISWITAFKAIPWGQVVENAPTVLRGAKKLWGMAQPQLGEHSRIEQDVAEVKDELAKAAQLIASLAEQNARLVEAVDILRVRTRALLVGGGVLLAAVVALAVLVLAR